MNDNNNAPVETLKKFEAPTPPGARRTGLTDAQNGPHGAPETRTNTPIDWATFLSGDMPDPQWTAGRLMERGQLASLVGHGKAGKSLFSLEWATSVASGRKFISDEPREPLRVLYLDAENSYIDLRRRIEAFGFTPYDLKNLSYLSFPQIGPLDTASGSLDLRREVTEYRPDVVFIDTISRFITGKENDADTWLSVYRHSLKPLKREGISVVRLDHFGKDATQGARGNSAKTQDVDHVWELTATTGGGLRLTRTHTRTGLGADTLHLQRHGRPGEHGTTWHEVVSEAENSPKTNEWIDASAIAEKLNAAGVPKNVGRPRARHACETLGIAVSNEVLSEAIRMRKNAP